VTAWTCCWVRCDGGWPGSCHEHELIELSGLGEVLDATGVASLLDRGFQGLATGREHWHAPVGDRRTEDRLSDAQRTFNRLQAGLRALVEQAIAHLAGAWSLRGWRGLLYRVRDVYRAASALVCLGRWLHGSPYDSGFAFHAASAAPVACAWRSSSRVGVTSRDGRNWAASSSRRSAVSMPASETACLVR